MFDKAVSFCGSNLNYRDVAASLNVLDYDTYFRVVDTLLGGDYASALLLFDEILTRGFGASVFMQGLAAHMRSLLVCKQPATAHLLEVTGTVREHYASQAERCSAEFLFESIQLFAEVDGRLRTSSNQRLVVELALMKLCGMGQKKNFDLESDLPLPELVREQQTAENQPVASVAQPVAKPQTTPQPTPKVEVPVAPPTTPQPESAITPKSLVESAPAASQPAEQSGAQGSLLGSLSGSSIMSLLNDSDKIGRVVVEEESAKKESFESNVTIDPETQHKIEECKDRFVEALMAERQRFGVAFGDMVVEGNKITITVASNDLHDEILRSKYEILSLLAELANIHGLIELEVNVSADKAKAEILIKPEDKIHHLFGQNPELQQLRTALDLDIE
jgi:DNA polymerase-3 subunit gamma/tau